MGTEFLPDARQFAELVNLFDCEESVYQPTERWKALSEQAAAEQNGDPLLEIIKELNRVRYERATGAETQNGHPLGRVGATHTARIMAARCEITEVAHSEDVVGYPCSNKASEKCTDCGTCLCDAHAEHCDICNQTFCATCLVFHNGEQHQKKPAAVDDSRKHRRSA